MNVPQHCDLFIVVLAWETQCVDLAPDYLLEIYPVQTGGDNERRIWHEYHISGAFRLWKIWAYGVSNPACLPSQSGGTVLSYARLSVFIWVMYKLEAFSIKCAAVWQVFNIGIRIPCDQIASHCIFIHFPPFIVIQVNPNGRMFFISGLGCCKFLDYSIWKSLFLRFLHIHSLCNTLLTLLPGFWGWKCCHLVTRFVSAIAIDLSVQLWR